MVEATDFAKRHDPAASWPFARPPVGRVLVEREMCSGAVILEANEKLTVCARIE